MVDSRSRRRRPLVRRETRSPAALGTEAQHRGHAQLANPPKSAISTKNTRGFRTIASPHAVSADKQTVPHVRSSPCSGQNKRARTDAADNARTSGRPAETTTANQPSAHLRESLLPTGDGVNQFKAPAGSGGLNRKSRQLGPVCPASPNGDLRLVGAERRTPVGSALPLQSCTQIAPPPNPPIAPLPSTIASSWFGPCWSPAERVSWITQLHQAARRSFVTFVNLTRSSAAGPVTALSRVSLKRPRRGSRYQLSRAFAPQCCPAGSPASLAAPPTAAEPHATDSKPRATTRTARPTGPVSYVVRR